MRDGLSGFGAEERKSDFYEIWGGKIDFFFFKLKTKTRVFHDEKAIIANFTDHLV